MANRVIIHSLVLILRNVIDPLVSLLNLNNQQPLRSRRPPTGLPLRLPRLRSAITVGRRTRVSTSATCHFHMLYTLVHSFVCMVFAQITLALLTSIDAFVVCDSCIYINPCAEQFAFAAFNFACLTVMLRPNVYRFTDDTFKVISLYLYCCILIQMSVKFLPIDHSAIIQNWFR